MNNQGGSFWDHVEELRSTLIRVLTTIFSASLFAFLFYQQILNFLMVPLEGEKLRTEEISQIKVTNTSDKALFYTLPKGAELSIQSHPHTDQTIKILPQESVFYTYPKPKLAIFSPVEGIAAILKICIWVGVLASSPIWLFWIYLFIAPAMSANEKKHFIPFTLISLLFSCLGLAFCYSTTIPLANHFLSAFNTEIGSNLWGLSNYLSYTLILLIGNVLAFEMCVILFFLIHFGKITGEGMRKYRSLSIIGIFVLSAILTPPDVFTQIMLAVPLICFYELGIFYAESRNRRKGGKKIENTLIQ